MFVFVSYQLEGYGLEIIRKKNVTTFYFVNFQTFLTAYVYFNRRQPTFPPK